MATHSYRYYWSPVDVADDINRYIDPNFPVSLIKQWGDMVIDIQADDSTKMDLDNVMARLGWVFVEDQPENQFPFVVPTTVGGDNIRGGRRSILSMASRALNQPVPPPVIFTSSGTALAGMDFVTPVNTWFGGHAAGTYIAVVDSSITAFPVSIIDKTTGAVVQTLPNITIGTPAGWNRICNLGLVGGAPADDQIMIRHTNADIVCISLTSGAVQGSIGNNVPAGPCHFFNDGAAVYLVGGDGALYTIAATAGTGGPWTQIQAPATFDAATQYIASDGRYLYIPQPTSNRIARIGPNYHTASAPVAFFTDFGGAAAPQTPVGIAYDGRFLWVTLSGQGLLLQLDPASPFLQSIQTKACLSSNGVSQAVAWDGDSLWATFPGSNTSNAGLGRVDPEKTLTLGNGMLGTFPGFNGAAELLVRPTPGGTRIYILSTGDNTVRMLLNEPLQ